MLSEPNPVVLREAPVNIINAGAQYSQTHDGIHKTDALDGTVTLVRRTFSGNVDRDSANVYVPCDEQWGDAKPREATVEEVADIVSRSLVTWFAESKIGESGCE